MPQWPWINRQFAFDFPATKYPDLLERLHGTPARLAQRTANLNAERLTHHDGKGWSIQENIGHLLTVESLWLGRLDDFDNGAEVLRPADMTNRKTHDAGFNDQSMASIMGAFCQERSKLIDRLERLAPERFSQISHHPRLEQPMRLVDLLHFIAEHDDYHLARITEIRRALVDEERCSDKPPSDTVLHLDARDGYDLWATLYDKEQNPLVILEEPIVRRWLGDLQGRRVADVGCGTGRHAVWMAEQGADVRAFDASVGMMSKAREKFAGQGVTFTEHTLPDPLPVEDAAFDAVVLALVADHLADRATTFAELRRGLKPSGTLVFTVLHPAMNLLGITARFTDPTSGSEVRVAAFEHTYADYITAALNAGFDVSEIVERSVDEALVKKTLRAEKYLGWPLLLAMRMTKP